MSTLSKSLMAMGLAALMIAPASAQERRGPGGGMMGRGMGSVSMLLSNKSVQDELRLDAAQKEKVDEAASKAREKFESARQSSQGGQGQERFARMRELTREVDAETMKSLADVLKPEQVTRLHGIHYQTLGAAAFLDENLQKALQLTDEQKSVVEEALADSREAMRDAFQGDPESARSKMREIRKEAVSKIEAKLTDEQKAEYKKLIGAPFEVQFEGRGAGR